MCAAAFVLAAAFAAGPLSAEPRAEVLALVPPGLTYKSDVSGDLNGDGRADLVLVLDAGEDERLVHIYEGTGGKPVLAAVISDLAYCARCGGVFGDPFDEPDITGGTLVIQNYGGSAWRWGHSYHIEKINGAYRLTGYTRSGFHSAEECTNRTLEADLRAGRVYLSLETGKLEDGSCEAREETHLIKPGALLLEAGSFGRLLDESDYPEFFREAYNLDRRRP